MAGMYMNLLSTGRCLSFNFFSKKSDDSTLLNAMGIRQRLLAADRCWCRICSIRAEPSSSTVSSHIMPYLCHFWIALRTGVSFQARTRPFHLQCTGASQALKGGPGSVDDVITSSFPRLLLERGTETGRDW